jgi:hypothetical protein
LSKEDDEMKHVFVRIEEGGNVEQRSPSCLLLSGDSAKTFTENPDRFIQDYGNDARILESWVVPADLENAAASDPLKHVFDALLALDTLGEFPAVSDLFATIFEAGYQLALKKKD